MADTKQAVRIYPRRVTSVLGWSALGLLLGPALLDIVMRQLGMGVLHSDLALTAALAGAPALGLTAAYLRIAGLPYKKEIPRSDIVEGFTAPRWASADVELGLRGGKNVSVHVDSVAAGDALLVELGVDPAKRRGRIRLAGDAKRIFTGFSISFLATIAVMFLTFVSISVFKLPTPLPLPGIIALFAAWIGGPWAMIAATRPPTLIVGSDGVSVQLALGRKRFIPLSQIESAVAHGPMVRMQLRNNGVLDYGGTWTASVDRAAAAAKRIQDAVDARESAVLTEAKLGLLGRQARTIPAWREALKRLTREGDYRGQSLSVGDLHDVLDSEVASVEQKLAAAMALRAADPEAAKDKVRVAANRSANEHVRIALNSTLEAEDDAAIEEALRADEKARATA